MNSGVILTLFTISAAFALRGVEVIHYDGVQAGDEYPCLVQSGYTHAIFGGRGRTGELTGSDEINVYAAKNANMKVLLYIDPCFNCGTDARFGLINYFCRNLANNSLS